MKAMKITTTVQREAFGQALEVEVVVEYTYDPGEKEIRYGDNAQPGCDPSVEIDSPVVKATGEAIELTEEESGWIGDEIIDGMVD